MWFQFPLIQGLTNITAVEKIADLRTLNGNREANTYSLTKIFEIMHEGRKTNKELQQEMHDHVQNVLDKEKSK
jgi:hypothetical protein